MQKTRQYTIRRPNIARNTYVHAVSPFLSRITFHWVTDLLSRGYHAPLELYDLGQLPDKETTRNQFERFHDIYESERVTTLRFLFFPNIPQNFLHFTKSNRLFNCNCSMHNMYMYN